VVRSKDPDIAKPSLPPPEFPEEFHADSVNDKWLLSEERTSTASTLPTSLFSTSRPRTGHNSSYTGPYRVVELGIRELDEQVGLEKIASA